MRTKLLTRLAAGAAFSLLLCLPAPSQDRGSIQAAQGTAAAAAGSDWERDHDRLRDLIHCVRILELTDAQQAAIQQFIEGEKPALQTLRDTLKADRQTLRTDASATPPDPCKVGSDFLAVRADAQAIGVAIAKIRDFVVSQLTDDQKARFEGCIQGTDLATIK